MAAVDILNTTTLSEALSDTTSRFTVGSTTNIAEGYILVVSDEAMKVESVPVSGEVKVHRGWNGTRAKAHASADRVFIGTANQFKTIKDNATALVGDSGVLPDYLLPGQRARDGRGNEYIMVELTAATYSGTTVSISKDGSFTSAALTNTHNGPVGLTTEGGTSDQYVWAQIYGYNSFAQDTIAASGGTSAQFAMVATTASTPSVGLAVSSITSFSSVLGAGQYHIFGMFIQGAATTATTSATSATGVAYPVFLNYPWVPGYPVRTANSS